MKRREVLKRSALILGSAIVAPSIMGVLKGCTFKPEIDWKPVFFTEDQAIAVTLIAELIIPATDTPGAIAARVPEYIEETVKDMYKQKDRDYFMESFTTFLAEAEKKYKDPFIQLEPAQQAEYVKLTHDAAMQEKKDFKNENGAVYKRPFILSMKELTMSGFFTSEIGATKVLQHVSVPGHYHGCRPLAEVGKTWA